jgi:PAS domain S-box-containing protein
MQEEEYSHYWKTVVETMMDGLMVVDTDGVIAMSNEAMEMITGYKKEELVGQSCAVLHCNTCFDTMARGDGMHCELFKLGRVRRCRCTLKRKDGTSVHVLKNAAILKDAQGQVIGGVETLTDLSELVTRDREIRDLRRELSAKDGFHGLVGKSPAMERVFDLISSAAASDAPAVIYGESGTGKELVAAAIHDIGGRRKGPFIKVNCAALNESLLESELFGHVKGAFTGADRTRLGRFEAAHGGDIFLDEIGDLPLSTQVKLLRVLQEKEIEKVGDHQPKVVDVRVISATNKDLNQLMDEERFREDLYYRIGVIPIRLPPLRERHGDIPLLIETFMHRIGLKNRKSITAISKEALEDLNNYHWPGNVRELINAIEYAFVVCKGEEILLEHLPEKITRKGKSLPSASIKRQKRSIGGGSEREQILEALKAAGGKKTEAARMLGISRVTFWKRLKSHAIRMDEIIENQQRR